jgi:TldD protein
MAVRDRAAKLGVSFADVRAVMDDYTRISRQDGKADRMSCGQSAGVSVRVLKGATWGFSSTNATDLASATDCLEQAVAAAGIAAGGEPFEMASLPAHEETVILEAEIDPRSISAEEKMAVLRRHEDELIRVAGAHAVNTNVSLSDSVHTTIVCNTQGALVEQEMTRVGIYCSLVTADSGVRQSAAESRARVQGWEALMEVTTEGFSTKAAKRAVDLLSAKRAPAGVFPVILHPSVVGVFIHEAFGHNAEADAVIAGESILQGKLGTQVASDLVSVIDDSAIPGLWGHYRYDSEGTPGRKREVIKDGTLVGLLHTLESAGRMGVAPNGSGRADGYANRPIVRMSNTIMVAGETPVEELIRGVDQGVMFEDGRWGYVYCEKGQYTLNAGSGRMIRNGEPAEMVRDCCVCGMVLETLQRVDCVSRESEISWGGGSCGKNGQSMPVSGGGPYIRVADMVVGGQETVAKGGAR